MTDSNNIIDPNDLEKLGYGMIRQSVITNLLSMLKANKENTTVDLNGKATITQGDITLTVKNYQNLTGLKTSTFQLLDMLIADFTDKGNPTVKFSLKDYMNKRGLKDVKEARKQVKDDLELLFNLSVNFTLNTDGKPRKRTIENFIDMRIIINKGIVHGIVFATFEPNFCSMLQKSPVMVFPTLLWEVNNKYNPNTYYLLRKISTHKNMNYGKKNEDVIRVQTLLNSSPFLLTYEKVKLNDRNFSKHIIKPFERDLNACSDYFTWGYCHKGNTPLSDEELQNLSYFDFAKCLVKFDCKNYPKQKRLEQKKERLLKIKNEKLGG